MTVVESEIGSFAEPGETVVPKEGLEKFISFELGGRLCCIAAAGVAEVVPPTRVASMPNSPDWLLGLIALRGEPVAVVNPAIIASPTAENSCKAKVMIFRPRPGEVQFALPIDSLQEIVLAPNKENRPEKFEVKGHPVTFIDQEQIFDGLDQGRN
ncbi:MAG: chemotaxis protein CheW [Pyrinomonadaceae bacterium]